MSTAEKIAIGLAILLVFGWVVGMIRYLWMTEAEYERIKRKAERQRSVYK